MSIQRYACAVIAVLALTHMGITDSQAGTLSGLAWNSGASCGLQDFEAWRGRPNDVYSNWALRNTWADIENPEAAVNKFKGRPGRLVLGIGFIPYFEKITNYAACARGEYDGHFKELGRNLVRLKRGNSILRLGWEANRAKAYWSISKDPTNYAPCFRREVNAIRSTAPAVKIEWSMNFDSSVTVPIEKVYPGDAHVDIIGISFYDSWPDYPDQATWDAWYLRWRNNWARGIGAWLAFAKKHGKKFALAEWALHDDGVNGFDNPFFIKKMFGFFKANAGAIAYEAYFNCSGGNSDIFDIYPESYNPLGAAQYRALYRKG